MSNKEFAFKPAPWLPKCAPDVLDRVRNIAREEMEYTNENGYSVRVVPGVHVDDRLPRIPISAIRHLLR